MAIDDLLTTASSQSTSLEDYKHSMRILGRHLAFDKLVAVVGGRAMPFHVVCSVEDFDNIGLEVVRTLISCGAEVRFSCLWHEHQVLMTKPWLDQAPINRAFDQPLGNAVHHLIVVASVIGTVTPVETMLLKVLSAEGCPGYGDIHIIAPIAHRRAFFSIKRKLSADFSGPIYWHGMRLDRNLRPDGSPSPGIGQSAASRVGLGELAARRRHIPDYIRYLMRSAPDSGPENSGNPGPRPSPNPSPDRMPEINVEPKMVFVANADYIITKDIDFVDNAPVNDDYKNDARVEFDFSTGLDFDMEETPDFEAEAEPDVNVEVDIEVVSEFDHDHDFDEDMKWSDNDGYEND